MTHMPDPRESVPMGLARLAHAALREARNWRGLIPSQCPLCSGATHGAALCSGCHSLVTSGMRGAVPRCARCCLRLDEQDACPDCHANAPAFDRIIAAFDYVEPADVLIHRLKVARRFTEAPLVAELLADEVGRVWRNLPSGLIVVPVPASRQAIKTRGFNPAAEIGRVLARRLDVAYRPGVLRRRRDGHKQATLSREARMMATSRLYQVTADVHGARIAVVDDVMTTGSTMHSISRMLKRSGAASVHGLVVARTPRLSS